MARLDNGSTVCALIPHYECEDWLGEAIASLLDQTRPVDAIVVIDDGSQVPPVAIVERFPRVTLLRSTENVGPYGLVQAVIDATEFDAYLFQDADDWSARDRLEALLDVATSSGSELVGCQEVRLLVGTARTRPFRYPLDVNAALQQNPTAHTLQHPTSLVSRELVRRVGGFATGLRFAGDTEFLRRATHVARIRNADHFAYFRRQRPDSLTMASDTGMKSLQRTALHDQLSARARSNAAAAREGRPLDLRPWSVGDPPRLELLAGPSPERGRRRVARRARRPASERNPVFVFGAPRSGYVELAWALGQAEGFVTLPERRWLVQAVGVIDDSLEQHAIPRPPNYPAVISRALGEFMQPSDRRAVVPLSAGGTPFPALVENFPEARYVHVVRDPDEIASSLKMSPMEDGVLYKSDRAYKRWMRDFQVGVVLEKSVGEKALRISHKRLLLTPHVALTELFAFLGCPGQAEAAVLTTANLFVRPRFGVARPKSTQATNARQMWRAYQRGGHLPHPEQVRDIVSLRNALRLIPELGAAEIPVVHGLKRLVYDATAQGSVVVVVSRGDEALVNLDGRSGWHFPRTLDGYYAGYHPASSDEAIQHLEHLRTLGATHFVMPATAYWWLEYYADLSNYLAKQARLVAFLETCGAVWDIGTRQGSHAVSSQSIGHTGQLHGV